MEVGSCKVEDESSTPTRVPSIPSRKLKTLFLNFEHSLSRCNFPLRSVGDPCLPGFRSQGTPVSSPFTRAPRTRTPYEGYSSLSVPSLLTTRGCRRGPGPPVTPAPHSDGPDTMRLPTTEFPVSWVSAGTASSLGVSTGVSAGPHSPRFLLDYVAALGVHPAQTDVKQIFPGPSSYLPFLPTLGSFTKSKQGPPFSSR